MPSGGSRNAFMATQLNLKGLNFLVADENEGFRTILARILRDFGANSVKRCGTGEDVLALLGQEALDCLMLDSLLPGIDGFALSRRLRGEENAHRHVPIIILTGHARKGDVERARDSGASMVMAKPVSPRTVYTHLVWAAESERAFVNTSDYAGPDRRFRAAGRSDGAERRGGGPAGAGGGGDA